MIASLQISVAQQQGITRLQQLYFTPPFKVANITADRSAAKLELMLMCSSPGILDGDCYDLQIDVAANASLQLHTQSYQRLFQMKQGASQQMQVHLASGGSFTYLPHPAVPHEASIFKSTNNIYLQDNCKLTWGEIITCGRQLKDEVFTFSSYHNLTQVFIKNKLVIRENLLMQPAKQNLQLMGLLESFTHQASLICLGKDDALTERMDIIYEWLLQQPNMQFGISKAPVPGFIVRILGYKAEQLHDCLKAINELQVMKSMSQ